jgi:hypothetical protein
MTPRLRGLERRIDLMAATILSDLLRSCFSAPLNACVLALVGKPRFRKRHFPSTIAYAGRLRWPTSRRMNAPFSLVALRRL